MDTELDGWLASETMVARVAAAHQLAKRYEPALETITRQEETLSIIAETVVTLGEDVSWERKRADDLQAEKDLIAEKLGLIEEEPEPEPLIEPPETADDLPVAHASDGMDHDDAAANADPGPDDRGGWRIMGHSMKENQFATRTSVRTANSRRGRGKASASLPLYPISESSSSTRPTMTTTQPVVAISGCGFHIWWQDGPIDREAGEEAHGAFVEDVLLGVINRMEFYQGSKFACEENDRKR